jgi:hypothetical protein
MKYLLSEKGAPGFSLGENKFFFTLRTRGSKLALKTREVLGGHKLWELKDSMKRNGLRCNRSGGSKGLSSFLYRKAVYLRKIPSWQLKEKPNPERD